MYTAERLFPSPAVQRMYSLPAAQRLYPWAGELGDDYAAVAAAALQFVEASLPVFES
jgi:hypothetical protein